MKLEEVDRSGQKWSEMKILDFIFRQEYLLVGVLLIGVRFGVRVGVRVGVIVGAR